MKISKNCITRLSIYKRHLKSLRERGLKYISSQRLGEMTGIKPFQIRKDLAYFGQFGTRKVGYGVDNLINTLTHILGTSQIQNVILIGAGHLGTALLSYKGFLREGINIVAAFDLDIKKNYSKRIKVPILAMDRLKDFIKNNNIKIAILTIPSDAAQEVSDKLYKAGIIGILNFAPTNLNLPENVIVSYVNLATELERLIYFVNSPRSCLSQESSLQYKGRGLQKLHVR